MITILHGDDIAKSRTEYVELKKKSKQPIILPGESISLQELTTALSSELLFSDQKDIFIENFFSKRKLIAKETKEIISYLDKHQDEHQLVFWENKKLTPAALKSFPKAKVLLFAIPQNLFRFIDAIAPSKGKELVSLFHETIGQSEPELVFFMMVRQLRILLSMALSAQTEEVRAIAPWQFQNLSRQLKNFSVEQLKRAYQNLFAIDLAQKTGRSSLSLTQAVDIFLFEL